MANARRGRIASSRVRLERTETAHPENRPVDHGEGKDGWTREIDKQHHAIGIRVVPDLMLVAVVKNQTLPLFLGPDVISHSNPANPFRLGDHQSEMIAKHPLVGSAVRRNILPGRQNGKHGGVHLGNLLQNSNGFRAACAVLFFNTSKRIKEERLPVVVIGNALLWRRVLLEIWDFFPASSGPVRPMRKTKPGANLSFE